MGVTKEYHGTRVLGALAEVAFGTASDLSRLDRWLPEEVSVVPLHDDVVAARWRAGDREGEARCTVSVVPERLRVEWRAEEPAGSSGWLEVEEAGAGSARVDVCLRAAGGGTPGEAPDEEAVNALLDRALRNLDREVGENFTAS
ncbi:SRPBCC family protein [Planomonospora corallina]|uniref:SRPBCC family protein n=1 Tax=Planomonospora corallina TaxID=1806052 RepID=A0ABV8I2I4_9ACTN